MGGTMKKLFLALLAFVVINAYVSYSEEDFMRLKYCTTLAAAFLAFGLAVHMSAKAKLQKTEIYLKNIRK